MIALVVSISTATVAATANGSLRAGTRYLYLAEAQEFTLTTLEVEINEIEQQVVAVEDATPDSTTVRHDCMSDYEYNKEGQIKLTRIGVPSSCVWQYSVNAENKSSKRSRKTNEEERGHYHGSKPNNINYSLDCVNSLCICMVPYYVFPSTCTCFRHG